MNRNNARTIRVLARVTTEGYPHPYGLFPPVCEQDGVEYETSNWKGAVLRRGVVLCLCGRGSWIVREHGSGLTHKIRPSHIRRVYRGGKEVARTPHVQEMDRVPLAPGAVENGTGVGRAWPSYDTMLQLPHTRDHAYKVGDGVRYIGRDGREMNGEVRSAHISTITKRLRLLVDLDTSGATTEPPVEAVRRVWRDGALVAVHPDEITWPGAADV